MAIPAPKSIKVYTRVRPPNESLAEFSRLDPEPESGHVVKVLDSTSLVFNPSSLRAFAPTTLYTTSRRKQHYDQSYVFDGVFGPGSSEDEIYTTVAEPMLSTALRGFHASIFAYGATGCGKSHTIDAFIERIAEDLFKKLESLFEVATVSVGATYLQIYNEKISDLLPRKGMQGLGGKQRGLDIRDVPHRKGEVTIPGLAEYTIGSAEEFRELYLRGKQNRVIAATQANSVSSRSHAVLTIKIAQQFHDGRDALVSKLCIIDLAGNERAHKSHNSGARMVEGASINRSLLSLGNCINAQARRRAFVPYRESKLTRLLHFALNGNCRTAMVVCISPSISQFEETYNSLEYGKRTGNIAKNVTRNEKAPSIFERLHGLERQHAELNKWRNDVAARIYALKPSVQTAVERCGGLAQITPEEFVGAIMRDTPATPKSSGCVYTQSRVDLVSPPRRQDTLSKDISPQRSIKLPSPLKRSHSLRAVSSASSTPSEFVKRMHV